jgi:hypothetical protein
MWKCMLSLVLLGFAAGGKPAPQDPTLTFAAYDVFVDSGNRTLGAWQFEWRVRGGKASIVGVEGGVGAFATAPYYDAAALQGGRIVIAAFSMAKELPQGRTRVARLHLQIEGGALPQFAAKLQACADGAGAACAGEMTWRQMESK